jgi:hypothetical protein
MAGADAAVLKLSVTMISAYIRLSMPVSIS